MVWRQNGERYVRFEISAGRSLLAVVYLFWWIVEESINKVKEEAVTFSSLPCCAYSAYRVVTP
jgi:hypothetical protein